MAYTTSQNQSVFLFIQSCHMLIYEREVSLQGAVNVAFHGSQSQREMEEAWINPSCKQNGDRLS